MVKLLVVDDEDMIREVVRLHAQMAGYQVSEAADAQAARALIEREKPDIALLDIMMPGEDGFSLAPFVLEKGIPVLFLTARTDVNDRVKGLRMGADDYILKPFEPAELLARLAGVLRRALRSEEVFDQDGLRVDFPSRRVWLRGEPLALTALEFDLLKVLVTRRREALSREELLDKVWGYNYLGETRTVDVHVQRLRQKIGMERVETVYKYGYRYCAAEDAG